MEDDNRDEAAAEAIRAAAERDDSEQDLQRLLEATRLENHDLPELPEPLRFTPSPIQESQAQPRHPTLTVEGQHRVDPLDQYDLLGRWPYPLPLYLLEPRGVGSQPNPFAGSSKTIGLGLPLLNRVLPVLAHTLSGIFHAPRRAVEMVLQVVSATIRHGERMMYRRARTWYLQQHPQADEAVLRDFDDTLDPDRKPPAADGTLHKSLRQLGVDDTLIVHPQCRNHDCGHVFYEVTRREDFSAMLPILCPGCQLPLRDASDKPQILHFGRRTLQSELYI